MYGMNVGEELDRARPIPPKGRDRINRIHHSHSYVSSYIGSGMFAWVENPMKAFYVTSNSPLSSPLSAGPVAQLV